MKKLTDAQRWWRDAQRKAEESTRAVEQAGSPFADQIERTTAEEQYRKRQLDSAHLGNRGAMAGELFKVGVRWSRYVLRRIARQPNDRSPALFVSEIVQPRRLGARRPRRPSKEG
jgi:hypothetical protein